jgi:hypothetical protein
MIPGGDSSETTQWVDLAIHDERGDMKQPQFRRNLKLENVVNGCPDLEQ